MIAIYARAQKHNKYYSNIQKQIEACKTFISPKTDYKVYSDNGFSGKDMNRPSLQKMLEDIELQKIDMVVVYKFDRLGRSIRCIEEITHFNNIKIVSVSEKLDTTAASEKIFSELAMIFANIAMKK